MPMDSDEWPAIYDGVQPEEIPVLIDNDEVLTYGVDNIKAGVEAYANECKNV